MATEPAPPPSWIAEGAPVVSFANGGPAVSRSTRITTVVKVNPKTFALDGEDLRYPIPGPDATEARSQRIGGIWGYHRVVVPLDSEEGQREVRDMRRRNAQHRADKAYAAWKQSRSAEDAAALYAALEDPNI